MRIHFISIGGAVMHNLALSLHESGHQVTGSDDEIYNPSRDRLAKQGLLPAQMGWFPDHITQAIDLCILGMHARKDNPELQKALALNIPIYSYPAYIYEHSKNKKRIVVAGSHGKTTTTSMIMHVLRYHGVDFDYLVGAQIEGFELMARLSNAPIIVMEGDEYPASAIDLRPKIHHYRPHIAIITGVAWDHINVFPTFEEYVYQFEQFIDMVEPDGRLIYAQEDPHLQALVARKYHRDTTFLPYKAFDATIQKNGQTILIGANKQQVPLQIFGAHNLSNLKAAFLACTAVGITEAQFLEAIGSFKGAAKRLQLLKKEVHFLAYLDFAHAPSKVQATVKAFKMQYPERQLIACLELHTFSSLNKTFLPEYAHTMDAADVAMVFFSPHTLEMKRLAPISKEEVARYFEHPNIQVFTDTLDFQKALNNIAWKGSNLLLMSSGTFGGMKYQEFANTLTL